MVLVLFFIHEGYSPNPIVQYHIARIPVHTICGVFDQGTLDSKVQVSLLVGDVKEGGMAHHSDMMA